MNRKKQMLESVYNFNSSFYLKQEQERLLKNIIKIMKIIDRKYFYSGTEVYLDTALPIGKGQTVSQPSTIARMIILAEIKKGEKVLEIGVGSGWTSCLISYLTQEKVKSLEIIPEIKEQAEKNIKNLNDNLKNKKKEKVNVDVEMKNILKQDIKERYDKIIFTAGINKNQEKNIEEIGIKNLKSRGKLICPYQFGPIVLLNKKNKEIKKESTKEKYLFVPLK